MKGTDNLLRDFDDLVFESRNKEYGAYQMRKLYNRHLFRAMLIALFIGASFIVIPFLRIIGQKDAIRAGSGSRYVSVNMENLEPPAEEIFIPPAPPPPPESQPLVKYVAPVIVDTVLPTEKPTLSVDEYKSIPESNTEEITVISSAGDNELVGDINGEGDDEPFILVEVTPKFKGGDLDKFRDWVTKRVIYPREAEENGIEGRVYLTFVVERDGTVSNVVVVRGIDALLDEAARKAIMESPPWSPGLQRGRPVRVRFSIYLNFTL